MILCLKHAKTEHVMEKKVYLVTAERAAVQIPGSGLKEAESLPAEEHSSVPHFVDNAVGGPVGADDLVAREVEFEGVVGEPVEPDFA